MPEKKTIESRAPRRREGKAPSTQAGEFVKEEMDHIREGKHGAKSVKAGDRDRALQGRAAPASRCRRRRREPRPSATRRKAAQDRTGGDPDPQAVEPRAAATRRGSEARAPRAASHRALSRQAHKAAARRSAASRSASAKKAAATRKRTVRRFETPGPPGPPPGDAAAHSLEEEPGRRSARRAQTRTGSRSRAVCALREAPSADPPPRARSSARMSSKRDQSLIAPRCEPGAGRAPGGGPRNRRTPRQAT